MKHLQLLEILLNLKNLLDTDSEEFSGHSICLFIEDHVYLDTGLKQLFQDLAAKWPKFSGDSLFPVPPVSCGSASAEFFKSNNFWSGEYGKLRRELLEFCITSLQQT